MSFTLANRPAFLDRPSFLPRVTKRDGRAIELALASPTLFDSGSGLDGAIAEAAYALDDPPLLRRLAQKRIPYLIDPQTIRFTPEGFESADFLARLPYAPDVPLDLDSATSSRVSALARGALWFQHGVGASCFMAAALPYTDRELDDCVGINDRLLAASCAANGTGEIERRPLVAQVVPGRRALSRPELIVNRLMDHPVDAVYVQPMRLKPTEHGPETLTTYIHFLLELRAAGFPVIAGRVGAFGLLLQALGVESFDSGLGQAEAFDLTHLNRDRKRRNGQAAQRGGHKRIYLAPLKTTLPSEAATQILSGSLRSRFTCSLSCCRFRGFEEIVSCRRDHYLRVRLDEVEQVRSRPTARVRQELVYQWLVDARDTAKLVRKALTLASVKSPSLDHLERWVRVLAREMDEAAAA